jgi:cytochrome c oxidase assembly protein subunit 15
MNLPAMSPSPLSSPAAPVQRRVFLLRRMAWICAVLVLAITSLSAYIRLSKAGLGCEPWPQCYGQQLRAQQQGEPPLQADAATAGARLAHRVIASSALLLVLVMVMAAVASRPVLWPLGRLALGLLGLALFLAVLGRWTAHAHIPAVTLGNLLGGFVMFAVSVRMALTGRPDSIPGGPPPRLACWAWLGAALLLAQVALGGLVSAGQAGLSCTGLTGCDLSAGSWHAFNPWAEPQTNAALPNHPAGAWVHVVHRIGGLVVVAVLLPLAAFTWRGGLRAVALLLLALLAAQIGLGVALVTLGLPLAAALAHNMAAALLLAVLLSIPVLVRSPRLSPAL